MRLPLTAQEIEIQVNGVVINVRLAAQILRKGTSIKQIGSANVHCMTDTAATSPETAVRSYLTYLSDPSKLVDAAEVAKLQKKVDSAKDPLDKLRAIAAVERAKATDPGSYRDGFIANAKQWAANEGVPGSAFRSMGVPDEVLRAAGLDGVAKRRSGKGKVSIIRTRRPAMRAEQLEQGILGMSGEFTTKDVVDQVGGSQLTVRTAIDRLEAQGKVTPAGERAGGRGRAAKTWKLI